MAATETTVTQEQVLDALRTVQDPDLHKDIVSLGFVKEVKICGGVVDFTIELTTPACPVKDQMKAEAATEIQAERERIRREIGTARDQALKEIYEQSVQLAALVSTKAIQRELTPADHARLLDDALRDLRTNLGTKT